MLVTFFAMAHMGFAQLHREEMAGFGSDPIKSLQVYPNPAVEFVSLKFETPHAKLVKLSVHNILGTTVEVETEVLDEHEIRLRVKDLANGYYFISVRDDRTNLKGTFKFLKK